MAVDVAQQSKRAGDALASPGSHPPTVCPCLAGPGHTAGTTSALQCHLRLSHALQHKTDLLRGVTLLTV